MKHFLYFLIGIAGALCADFSVWGQDIDLPPPSLDAPAAPTALPRSSVTNAPAPLPPVSPAAKAPGGSVNPIPPQSLPALGAPSAPVGIKEAPLAASAGAPRLANAPAPSATVVTPMPQLDFDFLKVVTDPLATNDALHRALSDKIAKVAFQNRTTDIFGSAPSGPLQMVATAPTKEAGGGPEVDAFMQAVHALRVEMISAQDGFIVADEREFYVGDVLTLQVGSFTAQAKIKEIQADGVVFENPADQRVTTLSLKENISTLVPNSTRTVESLNKIPGISPSRR